MLHKLLAAIVITIIPSLAFGQNVNLNEPDAELAASNIEEVLVPIQPILDIESLIRVEQEIIYSKLFGENVLIDEITDYITDIPEVEGDDPVSFDTLGITHDNRIYRVDCPLLFRVEFSEDLGHDEDVINFYSQNNINAYIAYGYLSDFASNSTVYFFGMILYSPTLNNGAPLLIPLKELPDATETEMQTILSATGTASEFQLAFPACTDLHGNPLTPDLEYDLCRESAYDKYRTDMDNRIRSLSNRGGAYVLIAGAAGAACIAFPPSCPIAIPIGIGAGIGALIDGTDAYSDFHNYSNTLGLDLRDCCRDLQVRSGATP